MDKDNRKIITLSFVIAAFLTYLVVQVVLEALASTFGVVARFYAQDIVKHGLPVASGAILFFALQFNKKVVKWADEVIVEVRKVVWPSRRDTVAMTIVSCVMLLLAGVLLGVFDFLSGSLVQTIVH